MRKLPTPLRVSPNFRNWSKQLKEQKLIGSGNELTNILAEKKHEIENILFPDMTNNIDDVFQKFN